MEVSGEKKVRRVGKKQKRIRQKERQKKKIGDIEKWDQTDREP